MNEDRELLAFVKGRLEEGIAPVPPRLAEIERLAAEESFALVAERRSRRRLWGTSLVAASLVAVCSFALLNVEPPPSPEQTVASVIDLLRAADGEESEPESESVAEMFLAWQDAPYKSAIADL